MGTMPDKGDPVLAEADHKLGHYEVGVKHCRVHGIQESLASCQWISDVAVPQDRDHAYPPAKPHHSRKQ